MVRLTEVGKPLSTLSHTHSLRRMRRLPPCDDLLPVCALCPGKGLQTSVCHLVTVCPSAAGPGAVLLPAVTAPTDVQQGKLGACFFHAALSILAKDRRRLLRLFVRPDVAGTDGAAVPPPADGVYSVRFFIDGERRTVTVDDTMPCKRDKAGRPELVYGRAADAAVMYVAVLEKAFAALHGGYGALAGGNMSEALRDLTGLPVAQVNLNDGATTPDALWGQLVSDHRCGWLLGAAHVAPQAAGGTSGAGAGAGGASGGAPAGRRPRRVAPRAVLPNHAFSVLGVHTGSTATGGRTRVLVLRNPWGGSTGASGDVDDGTSASALASCPAAVQKDIVAGSGRGVFVQTFDRFFKSFNRLYRCAPVPSALHATHCCGAWTAGTAGGNSAFATWRSNPCFTLDVRRPCSMVLSVSQPDGRGTLRVTADGRMTVRSVLRLRRVSRTPSCSVALLLLCCSTLNLALRCADCTTQRRLHCWCRARLTWCTARRTKTNETLGRSSPSALPGDWWSSRPRTCPACSPRFGCMRW